VRPRVTAFIAGLAIYMALVLAFYALHRVRYGHVDLYLTSIAAGERVFDAAKAVLPGFLIGRWYRSNVVGTAAAVGAIGGLAEVVLMNAFIGAHAFAVQPVRIAVTAILAGVACALTNSVGATAGAFWDERSQASNRSMQPTGHKGPAVD
jgi:hypothetical protein